MSPARQRQMRLLRPLVWERARGICEDAHCGRPADELQHALPRSRASVGDEHLLDREAVRALDADEFDPARHLAHLLALCHRHHALAHANSAWGAAVGLVIPGYVTSAVDGTPVYVGSHSRLAEAFGERGAA